MRTQTTHALLVALALAAALAAWSFGHRTSAREEERATNAVRESSSLARVVISRSGRDDTSVRRARDDTSPSDERETGQGPAEALGVVRAAAEDPSSEASAVLLRALDSDDEAARLEAIDALVGRKHVVAITRIVAMNPADDPHVGPTIIAALGELGASTTSRRDRDAVLARLVQLLEQEKERRGTDSPGYVLGIIEALGVLHHPDGAPVLERELFDSFHDVASRTTIVRALGQIGLRSSVAALVRLRAALEREPPPSDDFSAALDDELREAVDDVMRSLRGE